MARVKQKDIQFIKRQDRLAYERNYPDVSCRFLNHTSTIVDEDFGTQPKITYREPVVMPVLIKFDNLQKVQDKFNLEELPDAIAVFSKSVLEHTGLPNDYVTVEPDVLFDYVGYTWRISQVFPDDYISNSEEFLHYQCVIHRNDRSNNSN